MKIFSRKGVKYFLAFITISTVFYFMFRQLYYGWHEISNYQLEFRYNMFLLSFIPLGLNFLIASMCFQRLLRILGFSLNLTNTFKVISLSRLGKYIPGSFWMVLGQFYLFDKENVPKLTVFIANITMILVDTISVLLVLIPFYLFYLYPHFSFLKIAIIPVFCACILILYPKIFSRIVNLISFKFKGKTTMISYGYADLIFLLFVSLLDWPLFGVGLYLLINSFYPVSFGLIPVFAGTFAISWLLGIYFFIAPNGLGIREGVQTYLLSFFLPLPIAIIFSLIIRLWSTVGDLLCSSLAFMIKVTQDEYLRVRIVKSIK